MLCYTQQFSWVIPPRVKIIGITSRVFKICYSRKYVLFCFLHTLTRSKTQGKAFKHNHPIVIVVCDGSVNLGIVTSRTYIAVSFWRIVLRAFLTGKLVTTGFSPSPSWIPFAFYRVRFIALSPVSVWTTAAIWVAGPFGNRFYWTDTHK